MNEKIKNLNKEIEILTNDSTQKDQIIDRLNSDIVNLNSIIEFTNQQNLELKLHLNEYTEKEKQVDLQNKLNIEKINNLLKKIENMKKKFKKKHKKNLKLQRKIDNAVKIVQDLNNTKQMHENQLLNCVDEIESYEKEIAAMQQFMRKTSFYFIFIFILINFFFLTSFYSIN
jgi:chromosome segregation ATPase